MVDTGKTPAPTSKRKVDSPGGTVVKSTKLEMVMQMELECGLIVHTGAYLCMHTLPLGWDLLVKWPVGGELSDRL